jgi:hypothetical protein
MQGAPFARATNLLSHKHAASRSEQERAGGSPTQGDGGGSPVFSCAPRHSLENSWSALLKQSVPQKRSKMDSLFAADWIEV